MKTIKTITRGLLIFLLLSLSTFAKAQKQSVIIKPNNNIFDFVINNKESLFKENPIIFCGVNISKKPSNNQSNSNTKAINIKQFEAYTAISLLLIFVAIVIMLLIKINRINNSKKELTKKSEESFFDIVERAQESILIINEGILLYANNRFCKLSGYSTNELIGNYFINFVHAESTNNITNKKLLNSNNEIEIKLIHKSKKLLDVLISTGIVTYKEKPSVFIFLKDVTNYNKTLKQLQELKERYKSIFDNSISPSLLLDGQTIVECNNAAVKIYKAKNKEEVIGKTPLFFSPKYQANGKRSDERAQEKITKALENGAISFKWNHKDTSENIINTTVSLSPIKISEKDYLFASLENHSEESKLREALSVCHIKNNAILNNIKKPILIANEYTIIDCNNAAIDFFKAKQKTDIVGKTTLDLSPETQLNNLSSKEMADSIKFFFDNNGNTNFEWLHETFEGDMIYCDIHLSLIDFKNDENIMLCFIKEIFDK